MKQNALTPAALQAAMFGAPSAAFAVSPSVVTARHAALSFDWSIASAPVAAPAGVAASAMAEVAVVEPAMAETAAAAAAAAVPAAVAVMPVAAAVVRAAFGRIDANAWDTTGGAPSFQAYLCTGITTNHKTKCMTSSLTATSNKLATKPAINKTKTNKRPPSWSGPPNG